MNDPMHFSRWADEGGYMLHFERDANGALLVTITGGPSGPAAATLANFRVKHLIDWLIPESEAFNRGIASVMTIRCSEHAGVPPLNQNEFTGAECGACVAEGNETPTHAAPSQQAMDMLPVLSEWLYATNICTRLNTRAEEVDRCLRELMDAGLVNRSKKQPYSYRRSQATANGGDPLQRTGNSAPPVASKPEGFGA